MQVFPFVLVLLALPRSAASLTDPHARARSPARPSEKGSPRDHHATPLPPCSAGRGVPGRPAAGATHHPRHPGLAARITEILDSGMLTNGKTVAELEERAADLLDVPHVVAVSSCTAGLMLVLQAAGARGPVVMPSFTFAASAHAVVWAGGTPVWAEIRRDDLTLDPSDAAEQVDQTAPSP